MKKEKIYMILMGLMPFFLIVINHCFFYFGNRSLASVSSIFSFNPMYSIIVSYSIFLLLFLITKSYKKANIILIITSFLLTTINQIKLFYMQEPIYLSDLKLLRGIGDIFKITDGTYSFLSKYLLLFVIHLAIIIVLFIIIKKYKEEDSKRNYYFAIPIIILCLLSLPIKTINKIVKKAYGDFEDFESANNNIDYYSFYGLSGGMYFNMIDSLIFSPDNYNIDAVNEVLNYQSIDEPKDMDYNMIFVFSESFFDITKLDEIEYDDDILSSYHELSKKGKLIQMLSPTYGGRSCNVEFELLTSNNLSYFDPSYIPYLYFKKNDFDRYDNFITIMNNNNINTTSYITTSDSLYNVGKIYGYMGFKSKIDNQLKDTFISDKDLTNRIIEYVNNEDKNYFLFTTTMQNHMPYLIRKYEKYNVSLKNSKLSKEDQEAILSYSEGLYEASKELERLYDYINNLDTKTIIVFIGDHLPYLANINGDNLINKLKYFNTEDEVLNNYRKYNTEALIISNFDIDYDDTEYLSPDLLLPYILKMNKTKMNSYYNYLIEKSKNILPSYNRYVAQDNNGNIYDINKLPEDMKKEYDLRNNIQYKLYYE